MIEVYQWMTTGHPRLVECYENYNNFFCNYYEIRIRNEFGYTHNQKYRENNSYYQSHPLPWCDMYVKIAYSNGKLVTPDALVGRYRKYVKVIREKQWKRLLHSRSHFKCKHGSFKRPRTTQERRENIIVDSTEPSIRAKRKPDRLPNTWDDYYCKLERNWKSNRKTQWK